MNPLMPQYRTNSLERDRNEESFRPFRCEVLSVDWERKTVSVINLQNLVTYADVANFPALASSYSGTDLTMPEVGSRGIAIPLQARGGFFEIAIVSWVTSNTNQAQQGIASRPIDNGMEGWSTRTRGTYRKALPGQRTVTMTEGFSEKHDDGWDRLAADFSRDHLDPHRRERTQITGRSIQYHDGGLTVEGAVNRPGANGVGTDLLPDGTSLSTVYLAPGATQTLRYNQGQQDVIALVERTAKVQEFALDHPVPEEALSTILLNQALGVTGDPWLRTTVMSAGTGAVAHDSQATIVNQIWDHPTNKDGKAVGPTLAEGPTPQRRGYIIERSEGTLVGGNLFDLSTYGQPLKPVVFPLTRAGRFGANTESGYLPANASADQVETRVATSASSVRFPHEGNTTRWDVTKEGFMAIEIGSTLPKENIPLSGQTYEHPHGAGRSLEAHLVGSLKLVVGKNRDEEEAIDLQALGQTVLRLGADDTSLPNAGRVVKTQIRQQNDRPLDRTLQYWDLDHRTLKQQGDAGALDMKTGAENISLRGAFDGGAVLRIGARSPKSLRRHLMNGYQDGPGLNPWAPNDPNRIDSKSPGRPTYGPGDSIYRLANHDLTQIGKSQLKQPQLPYNWSGSPIINPDAAGLSLDLHLVQDALVRIGKNAANGGQSLVLDLGGGLVAAIGKDNQGRSITAQLDGGAEITIGSSTQGRALRIEFNGDVDWTVNGNFHLNVTGDSVFDSTSHQHIVKTDLMTRAQNQYHVALASHLVESPAIDYNQGLYS